jgi:hypothetical protein
VAGKIYERAIRIAAKVASSFKPDVLSAAAAVKRLGIETGKLKSAEKATESFGRLGAELQAARAKYNTTSEALARLKSAQEAAGGATKDSARWVAAGERALKSSERELNRVSAAAGRNAAALHAAGVDTTKLAHEQHRLAEALEATERRTKLAEAVEHHFGETLERAKKKVHELATAEGSLAIAREKGKQLGETVKHLAELTVGAEGAAFALFEVAKSTAEAAGDVEKMSERLGIGTEALQLMRYAGQATHTDVEELNTGLGKMAVNIGKVIAAKKKGGGLSGEVGGIQMLGMPGADKAGAVDPFKHIGLSAKELAQLAPEEQLAKIAGGINNLKTHSEKAAAAVAIFGKGGLAMLPLLAKGAEGLEEFYDQARASGNILSEETLEQSKQFHHAFLQSQQSILGVKNTLGSALLPVASEVLGDITRWVRENRGQIKQWAEQTATWIKGKAIPAIRELVPQVLAVAKQIGGWIATGLKLIGGVQNLGYALAALRLGSFAGSVVAVAGNFTKLALAVAEYALKTRAAAAAQKALNAGGGGEGGPGGAAGGAAAVAGAGKAAKAAAAVGGAVAGVVAGVAVGDDAYSKAGGAIAGGLAGAVGSLLGPALGQVIGGAVGGAAAYAIDAIGNLGGQSKSDAAAETERLNAMAKAAGDARRAQANAPAGGAASQVNNQIAYAPVINIQGNASKEDVEAANRKGREEFEAMYERMQAKQRRVSFA